MSVVELSVADGNRTSVEWQSNGSRLESYSLDGNEPYRGLSASAELLVIVVVNEKTPVHTYTSVCMRASHIAHVLA